MQNKTAIIVLAVADICLILTHTRYAQFVLPESLIIAIVIFTTRRAVLEKDFFQPIMFINVVIVLAFVFRPLFLLCQNNIFEKSFVFGCYRRLYGITETQVLDNLISALYLCAFGMLAMVLGYSIRTRYLRRSVQPRKTNDFTYRDANNKLILYLFMVLAALLFYRFIAKFGPLDLLSSMGVRMDIGIHLSFLDTAWASLLLGAIIHLYLWNACNNVPNTSVYILTGFSIAMALFIGSRAAAINVLIIIMVLEYYLGRRRTMTIRLGLFIIMIVIVAYGFAEVRAHNRNQSGGRTPYLYWIVGEFNMADSLAISLDYKEVAGSGLYLGKSYLGGLLTFIPRSLWDKKPLPFDYVHTEEVYKGTVKGGLPTSIIGSLYLNFGYLGLGLGCFLLGYLFRALYILFRIRARTFLDLAKYSILTTFIFDIVRVGDITRELFTFLISFLAFWTMFILFRKSNSKSHKKLTFFPCLTNTKFD